MCDICGCTPCKCGDKVEEGKCAGCGKPSNECECEPKEKAEEVLPAE